MFPPQRVLCATFNPLAFSLSFCCLQSITTYPCVYGHCPKTIQPATQGRFDADETFKKQAQLTVVKLQGGDKECTEVWKMLCDVSRKEFDKVPTCAHTRTRQNEVYAVFDVMISICYACTPTLMCSWTRTTSLTLLASFSHSLSLSLS